MNKLTDVTIYFDPREDNDVRRLTNYVCELYHANLKGYKPPKTSRITLMFQGSIPFDKPFFTGSICGYYIRFEREEYETIQIQLEKYKFFLNKIHSACMTLCDKLDWNGTAFENAYKESIESGFRFRREYKRLRTRNKQHWGQSILEKTEETSTLKIRIENNEILEITMLQKQNWFLFDSANRLGDKMKWLDNDRFGFEAKESGELLYYSMSERKVSSNLRPRPWGM